MNGASALIFSSVGCTNLAFLPSLLSTVFRSPVKRIKGTFWHCTNLAFKGNVFVYCAALVKEKTRKNNDDQRACRRGCAKVE